MDAKSQEKYLFSPKIIRSKRKGTRPIKIRKHV